MQDIETKLSSLALSSNSTAAPLGEFLANEEPSAERNVPAWFQPWAKSILKLVAPEKRPADASSKRWSSADGSSFQLEELGGFEGGERFPAGGATQRTAIPAMAESGIRRRLRLVPLVLFAVLALVVHSVAFVTYQRATRRDLFLPAAPRARCATFLRLLSQSSCNPLSSRVLPPGRSLRPVSSSL